MQDTALRIPVFVSCPRSIPGAQEKTVKSLRGLLEDNGLEWRQIELTEYSPRESPVEMILRVIQKCYGGLILGFEHSRAESVVVRRGQASQAVFISQALASPWGQIEAAVLLARNLPVLILKDRDVTGGIFDLGSVPYPIFDLPDSNQAAGELLAGVFIAWARAVREHYEKVNSIFDVFLSFSGEDESSAREVFEFLTSQGLRVFFSRESIPQLGQADYMKAINTALDKARHMVVVSSSAEGFAKAWVEREWTMFLNEKLSGRKSGNIVVMPAGEVPVAHLPIALRSQQVVGLSSGGLLDILRFVSIDQDGGLK
jgi:hypothetical protein